MFLSGLNRGSSPRMRGTHLHLTAGVRTLGLIPTYAGNTHDYKAVWCRVWAHPHVCGEHPSVPTFTRCPAGSSPRMRGTRCAAVKSVVFDRAHPHVCGEHYRCFLERTAGRGSSPRMRGTLPAQGVDDRRAGLIPTYAGNTHPQHRADQNNRAHPHVCGEHRLLSGGYHVAKGSSPRMRGTRRLSRDERPTVGLIPTYAGNTF